MISLLHSMLSELQEYKRDHESLMYTYVSERLEQSFQEYDKELQNSLMELTVKHEKSLLKRMKKLDGKHS